MELDLALSFAYWVHMLATILWIGGLAALVLIVLPAARQALESGPYAAFLERLQRRLDPLAWFSLVLLIATGMFQMSASPQYEGFLSVTSAWAAAILLKHLFFFAMIGVSAYMTWGVLPALRRMALIQSRSKVVDEQELSRLQRREALLVRLNLVLGVIVLAFTAIARAA
jgi:uncharacterized membrane protein